MASGGRPEGDQGVVEPLRLPDGVVQRWQRSVVWFSGQPLPGRLFIALSALDVLARGVGVVGPPLVLDLGTPISVLASVLPHNLLIALPALVVIRRPSAASGTPNILDGAILVALAELLSYPSTAFASMIGGIGPWAIVAIAATMVQVVGWVAIGRGLTNLNPLDANPSTAGWANLAAFGILGSVVVSVVAYLVGPGIDVGDAELNRLLTLNSLAQLLAPAALAYLGRSVVRGLDDRTRAAAALRLGAAAIFLAAGLGLAFSLVDTLAFAGVPLAQSIAEVPAWSALHWLGSGGAVSLLLLAFGLGLADPVEQGVREGVTLEPS